MIKIDVKQPDLCYETRNISVTRTCFSPVNI